MESLTKEKESENLAERLRSLYQIHGCEHELPAHDDLVAKLDAAGSEVRAATKMELNRDYVHLLSYEEALQLAKCPFHERLGWCYALAILEGMEYASSKNTPREIQEDEANSFLFKLRALYGGFKALPSTVKTILLTPTEEEAKELMEEHNKDALQYFKAFKRNLDYFLTEGGNRLLNSENQVLKTN